MFPSRSRYPILHLQRPRLRQVPRQPLFTLCMNRMTMSDFPKTVTHQELVVRSGKERRGNIYQDSYPRVILVGEGFAAVPDCCDDAGAEVTG